MHGDAAQSQYGTYIIHMEHTLFIWNIHYSYGTERIVACMETMRSHVCLQEAGILALDR